MDEQNFSISKLGDIEIADNNILLVTGRDVFVQGFRQILQTRKGEYFLNTDEGLYFQAFFDNKNPDIDDMHDALVEAASQIEDFVQFIELDFNFDIVKRILNVSFKAQFMDGSEVAIKEEVNFNA